MCCIDRLNSPYIPGIVEVAECHRLRGAGLLTGNRHLPVFHLPLLPARSVLRFHNPLDAECALLHHAPGSDCHIRVELPVQGLGPIMAEPVETPDFVRAVVCAIPRSDAPVIDLPVQTLFRVVESKVIVLKALQVPQK